MLTDIHIFFFSVFICESIIKHRKHLEILFQRGDHNEIKRITGRYDRCHEGKG